MWSGGDDMCTRQTDQMWYYWYTWLYTAAVIRYSCCYIPIHVASPPVGQY